MQGQASDFIAAALPWITIGVGLAIAVASTVKHQKDRAAGKTPEESKQSYIVPSMALGMCCGVLIGKYFFNNDPMFMSVGMWMGLAVGSLIKMKR